MPLNLYMGFERWLVVSAINNSVNMILVSSLEV